MIAIYGSDRATIVAPSEPRLPRNPLISIASNPAVCYKLAG